jgi:excisionase family DNA binding protein
MSAHEVPQATPLDPSDILTSAELAERLKVNPCWVYNKLRRGENCLPAIFLGRYLRFSWSAVSQWLQRQQRVTRARKSRRRNAVTR